MNVYDFDGTIYDGDSTIDFFLNCAKKYPLRIARVIPIQLGGFIRYRLGKCDKTELKSVFFSFLRLLPDVETEVELFWRGQQKKIKLWYLRQKTEDDVIISASPDFLLRYVCNTMGITRLIASQVNIKTGQFVAQNCYGNSKCTYFKQQYPNCIIEEFYSDSLSDQPMAQIAEKAYLVKGNNIFEWPKGVI